jgi:outer membrane protein assembly factor BamE (lipoprotein component of BamABCDE complex)
MKRVALLSLICLTGCIMSNGLGSLAVSDKNTNHLAQVRKGMSEREVFFVMRQPYECETFYLEEDVYDVWFYVTKPTGLGQTRMVPQNLTPLIFKNGVLVGRGYEYYRTLQKREAKAEQEALVPSVEPAPKELEDKSLEKALETPKGSKKTAPALKKPISMAKRPGKQGPDDQKTLPPAEKEDPGLDEEGERMQEQESEENFDFW